MATGYLPGGDATFDAWLTQYASYAGVHADEIGLTAEDLAALNAVQIQWSTKFVANNAAHVALKESVAEKKDARTAAEDIVKAQVRRIQVNPTTTDANRQGLGITVPDTVPAELELPLTDVPVARMDINNKLKHTIVIRPEIELADKRWKPAGTMGCEIYRKVGEAPSGPHDMSLVTITTKNTVTLAFPDEDAGKVAHYLMRYVTHEGAAGPWSAMRSVSIAV